VGPTPDSVEFVSEYQPEFRLSWQN